MNRKVWLHVIYILGMLYTREQKSAFMICFYYKKVKSYVFMYLYVKTANVKIHFWYIFYTLLVYTKNPFWVCNIKNVHNYDAHIKNM